MDGVKIAGARIQPGHSRESCFLGGIEDRAGHRRVVHNVVVSLRAGKQVRQVENLIVFAEGFQDSIAGDTEINRARLRQLDHIGLRTQQLTGIHFHHIPVAKLFINKILKGGKRDMGWVVGGLVVANPDGSTRKLI